MRIDRWLAKATARLAKAGVATARLDALVLLEDCLNTDRARLLAHLETVLTAEQISQLAAQIERRAAHEPLAYIRGQSEFYGRVFSVDNNVLEPRPESETMIELLKKLVDKDGALDDKSTAGVNERVTIADIGTGSGALAITAKLELPGTTVIATDIDPACLGIARGNALRLGAEIRFAEGDLVDALSVPDTFSALGLPSALPTVLLCNLPYVPDDFSINRAAGHEPRLAIFGGTDGLELYRKLFAQLAVKLPRTSPASSTITRLLPRYILTESLPSQHDQLRELAGAHGYEQHSGDDFIQVFRLAQSA